MNNGPQYLRHYSVAQPDMRANAGGMSFFDDLPVPTGPRYRPRQCPHPWAPPEAEFPGIALVNTMQFERSEQAATAVTGISAYTAGFEIFITHRIRPGAHDIAGELMREPPGAMPAARTPRDIA